MRLFFSLFVTFRRRNVCEETSGRALAEVQDGRMYEDSRYTSVRMCACVRIFLYILCIHTHAHTHTFPDNFVSLFFLSESFFFRLSVALLFCFALSSRFRSLSLSLSSSSFTISSTSRETIREFVCFPFVFGLLFFPFLSFSRCLSRSLARSPFYLFILALASMYLQTTNAHIHTEKRTENEEDERARTTERMKEEEWWYCS